MKVYTLVGAVPSRIQGLARTLADSPDRALPREQLLELLNPPAFRLTADKPSNAVGDTISAAIEMGLIAEETRKGVEWVRLVPETKLPLARLVEELPRLVASLVLRPKIGREQNSFAELCAWILCQPLTAMPSGSSAIKKALTDQGLSLKDLKVTADPKIENVVHWGRWLGLIWQRRRGGCEGLVPDPTAFIDRHLGQLLPDGKEVEAEEFRARLGELCPVLDGGEVRATVMKKLTGLPAIPTSQLSEALSFALRRLRSMNKIEFWCIDDARNPCVLSGQLRREDGNNPRITHVRRKAGESSRR